MPHWHHCGCPYHRRGHVCPYCDEPAYRPRMPERLAPPEEEETEADRIGRELRSLRESAERVDDLEGA